MIGYSYGYVYAYIYIYKHIINIDVHIYIGIAMDIPLWVVSYIDFIYLFIDDYLVLWYQY